MEQIVDVLLSRLSQKGLSPEEVPWLIRDVLNAVCGAGEPAMDVVNRRLAILGWNEEILDGVTFDLIVYLAEKRGENRAEYRTEPPF